MATFLRLFLISIFTTGVVFFLHSASFFKTIDVRLTDTLYETSNRHTGDVVVVAIDEQSLREKSAGGLGRWQDWERSYYATVLENLRSSGAAVIGVDIFFSEPRNEQLTTLLQTFTQEAEVSVDEETIRSFAAKDDTALKESLATQSGTVLAAKTDGNRLAIFPTRAVYDPANTPVASVSFSEDFDSKVRSLPLIIGEKELPYSFAFEIVKQYLGVKASTIQSNENSIQLLQGTQKDTRTGKNYGPISIPLTSSGDMLVNYRGVPFSIPTLSFVDVYNGTYDPALVENKIVLIGEMDAGLHDEVYTPVSGTAMPGVEVHANAIETILTNSAIAQLPSPIQWSLVFLLSISTACIAYTLRTRFAVPLLIIVLIGYIAISYIVLQRLFFISSIWYPILAMVLSYIATLLLQYFTAEKEKNTAVDAFSHYLSSDLVTQIVADPSTLQLGGVRKELSISFTDIAGFTSLAEKLSPEILTEFLHDYFDTMTSITLNEQGTLDKYIGDAIMAFWGAPLPLYDHAERSVVAALEMHKALREVRERWKHVPELSDLQIRTGIATGEVTVGNFGSQTRFDYTVIGDTVNLASRLEGINKTYGTYICVDEETYLQTKARVLYRKIDRVKVQGKQKPVSIYQAMGYRSEASVTDHELVHSFEQALDLYLAGNFEEAVTRFTALYNHTEDPVSHLYIARSSSLLKSPPKGQWDGVFTMKKK